MAEAGRLPAEPEGEAGRLPAEPEGEAAAAPAPEPEAPAQPPAPALRWLPADLSPRGRSQSDLSACSSRARPLRLHISGSVDGLDRASIADSDGPPAGSQTPPFKRKGKLSTIGKIFKPWKWRKKKTSDKFRETSAVLERKISTRQSREELVRRGVIKELPDQDGDVTVNFENSNGHMIPIGEESTREENVGKSEEGNGSVSEKTPPREEKAEDKKAGSSHSKKPTGSKASTSPSTSSTSSRPKASKETVASKTGTVGTTKGKKKTGKQATASRLSSDTVTTGASDLKGEPSEARAEILQPDQTVPRAEEQSKGKAKPSIPPPLVAAPPSPPAPPLLLENQCIVALDTPVVLVSNGADLPVSTLDPSQLWTEEPTSRATVHSGAGLSVSRENAKCFITKDELEKAAPQLLTPGLMGESSESLSAPEDEGTREYQANDSDSDGPILYTDDDEEEDEDEDGGGESALASKIRRRDTLAIKLGNRPSKKELEDKNILQRTSEEERQEIRQQIGTKLVRRLSQRPTTEELEQRNILKQKNEEEEQEAKMELKRRLSRKLSLRPTVAELQARRILRFNEYVEVTDSPDYDRRADKPWARLTPADKAAIRKELNEFKSTEMEVHEESRQFTRFHRP
ncbi:phosphatase and actin regulator 2 isoform X5 [Heterocephalus glaber]|uniref:Phosphatase and actin regulator n=1 Tax=Heterocephalus glaber TaxID=10181 RepID=A0AAX6T4P2_HETGA|nr:phosphatase and actin regulator 2 isoform X5 [Heterocephalus glaber]